MLRSLFVDFNSYFASVEQQERPELRGRPVAVVPLMSDHTSCIAASYEAKAFGVKTGTNVGEAKVLCPGIVLVESRTRVYVEYHHRLVAAVESCLPVEKVHSVDEMSCALTGRWAERATALALALKVKATIAASVGAEMRCSIGIAPNRFLAKTASDMQKPDGLVILEVQDLPQALHRLELRDFAGIGEKMEARLHAHGIYTVEQLCAASRETLHAAWGGIEGSRLHEELRGGVVHRSAEERGSIGHSHVLGPERRSEAGALAVAHRLLQKAATRMRKLGLATQAIQVAVRHTNRTGWKADARLEATQDTLALERALEQLWAAHERHLADPMKVGVTLGDLVPETDLTVPLFDHEQRQARLARAVDAVTEAHGTHAAFFAGAHAAVDSAPARIAFRSIPQIAGTEAPEFRESFVYRDEDAAPERVDE